MGSNFERADVLLARRASGLPASTQHASSSGSSNASQNTPLETGLASLDSHLAALLPQSYTEGHSRSPSPRFLEIVGPTASGKSAFIVACAVKERLNQLVRATETWHNEAPKGNAKAKANDQTAEDCSITTDGWADVVKKRASSIMLIDTEGSCTPERLLTASKAIIGINSHLLDLARTIPSNPIEAGAEDDATSILTLSQAVLQGIMICRPTTLAQFLATVLLIDPHLSNGLRRRTTNIATQDEMAANPSSSPLNSSTALNSGQTDSTHSSMPPNTSLLLIDSISAFSRMAPTNSQEREQRSQMLGHLEALGGKIRRYNQACLNQRMGTLLNVIVANQMSVKMVPQDGSLLNFEEGSNLPNKVAKLVPQLQIVNPSGPSLSFANGMSSSPSVPTHVHVGRSFRNDDASAGLIGSRLNASVLGDEVWRVVLFRSGGAGHRLIAESLEINNDK
ncbi:hypothetical protein OC846_001810 [Tilletia horrida]|uniref:Uncharacterized protein n=1 Tax=Tilletia horrida TaxID=155126 RepID=A0AAN6GS45_9BASI|nr:hypothetical protein OC846_001810 [Tilletia horrida]